MNTATGDWTTVGGGDSNRVSNGGSTVGGGKSNTSTGVCTTVAGGKENIASFSGSAVGGGYFNTASGAYSFVGGGYQNAASDSCATIPGGGENTAGGKYSFAAGRRAKANHDGAFVWADSTYADFASTGNDELAARATGGVRLTVDTAGGGLRIQPHATSPNLIAGYSGNAISDTVHGAVIAGGGENGYLNRATDNYGTVGGGRQNVAGDGAGTLTDADYATVGGGHRNTASDEFATVGGGYWNTASGSRATVGGGSQNTASGSRATVGGGYNNTASDEFATVVGGRINRATGNHATVGGGDDNSAGGSHATVAGGWSNTASGGSAAIAGGWLNTVSGSEATVGGGYGNAASGQHGTVSGGYSNTASGVWSTVSGGALNVAAGNFSFAAGRAAKANHKGAFVWADSTPAALASTGNDQFLIRASGGVGIGTTAPATRLHVQHSVAGTASTLTSYVAVLENTASGGDGPDVLALKVAEDDPSAKANYITFFGNSDMVGAIDGNGSGGVTYKTTGGDVAEYLPRLHQDESLEAGDVVGLFAGQVTRATRGAHQFMVVTDRAALAGNMPDDGDSALYETVAFLGQVPVKVRGPVRAGDYILASGLGDGVAAAVSPAKTRLSDLDRIVGQAWESSDVPGVKRVNTVVGLPVAVRAAQTLLQAQQATVDRQQRQIHTMEQRLAALESIARTGRGRTLAAR